MELLHQGAGRRPANREERDLGDMPERLIVTLSASRSPRRPRNRSLVDN